MDDDFDFGEPGIVPPPSVAADLSLMDASMLVSSATMASPLERFSSQRRASAAVKDRLLSDSGSPSVERKRAESRSKSRAGKTGRRERSNDSQDTTHRKISHDNIDPNVLAEIEMALAESGETLDSVLPRRRRVRTPAVNLEDSKSASPREAESEEEELYCICRKPDDGRKMICCENCDDWFHVDCVGLPDEGISDKWFCPNCSEKFVEETKRDFADSEAERKKFLKRRSACIASGRIPCGNIYCGNDSVPPSKYCSRACGERVIMEWERRSQPGSRETRSSGKPQVQKVELLELDSFRDSEAVEELLNERGSLMDRFAFVERSRIELESQTKGLCAPLTTSSGTRKADNCGIDCPSCGDMIPSREATKHFLLCAARRLHLTPYGKTQEVCGFKLSSGVCKNARSDCLLHFGWKEGHVRRFSLEADHIRTRLSEIDTKIGIRRDKVERRKLLIEKIGHSA